MDDVVEEGVPFGVAVELVLAAVSGGGLVGADGVGEASVEAFDEAVGLRPVGPGEAVLDVVFAADLIEGMASGGLVVGLVLHVDGEAVGELAAVVGEDGVHGLWEVGDEALEEAGGGGGVAAAMDLEIDVAGGAVDGDEGVAFLPIEGRQTMASPLVRREMHDDDIGEAQIVRQVPEELA
jgi:hypothetical protein